MNTIIIEIIAIILFVFITILSYFVLKYEYFVSNMFILSSYLIVVPLLFFTLGAYIEKVVVESQIKRIINELKETANSLNYSIPKLKLSENNSLDKQVEENNKKIIINTIATLIPISILGLVSIYGLWYFKPVFKLKNLIYKDLFILLLIIIVEILFFLFISKNYRSIDANLIKYNILIELANATDMIGKKKDVKYYEM